MQSSELPGAVNPRSSLPVQATGVARGGLRRDLNFARSVYVYRSLFDELVSPQRIGLSEQDLATSWSGPHAVTASYLGQGGEQIDLPFLLPVDQLYWYNIEFFADVFGEARDIRYYTHAPVPIGGASKG